MIERMKEQNYLHNRRSKQLRHVDQFIYNKCSLLFHFPEGISMCLCWGLMTRQPLWVILFRLPEKGRKIEEIVEEIVEEMKEEQKRKRKMKESETEEIKTFPLYP